MKGKGRAGDGKFPTGAGPDESDGAGGDMAEQPRDPRLNGVVLQDLPGSAISSRSEENQVFALLSESLDTITEVFVHYSKHHDHHSVHAATRLCFGARGTFTRVARGRVAPRRLR